MPIVITFEKDTPAKRLVRVSSGGGFVLALLYLVWSSSPGCVSAAGRPVLQNFAVVSSAALFSIQDAAIAHCAGHSDTADRAFERDVAMAAAKHASDTLKAAQMPENVHYKQSTIDGRLGYLKHQLDAYMTTCDAAAKAKHDAYAEEIQMDIDALRNPTGAMAGGLKK